MKIGFLLGAGISIDAKMPKTGEITEALFTVKAWRSSDDGAYYIDQTTIAKSFPDEHTPRILQFLSLIKNEIDHYYNGDVGYVGANYEQIYYMVRQLQDSESGEYDNPAIEALKERLLPQIEPILEGKNISARNKISLLDLFSESANYIYDIVWRLIEQRSNKIGNLSYLQCLVDACNEKKIEAVDFYSLNHDLVLEALFDQNKIPLCDGFGDLIHHIQYWEPERFDSNKKKVRLLKLHGSIDWFFFDKNKINLHSIPYSVGKLEHVGIDHKNITAYDGVHWGATDSRPIFLVGTFNKMLQYTKSIFGYLYFKFYESLLNLDYLVISGYSFGDKGINDILVEWLLSSKNRKILVLHHNPSGLKSKARRVFERNWDNLVTDGKLILLSKNIQSASWAEIKKGLKI